MLQKSKKLQPKTYLNKVLALKTSRWLCNMVNAQKQKPLKFLERQTMIQLTPSQSQTEPMVDSFIVFIYNRNYFQQSQNFFLIIIVKIIILNYFSILSPDQEIMQNLPNHIFESINDFIFSEESKPLGSGSFGVVKKGVHKLTGKVYAIKIIQLNQSMNEPQMLLLSRQISIHYQLNHPHIIKLWAVIQQNFKIYMIMDFAENGNLFNYLNRKKVLTQAESYRIFYQVLNAIQYLHKFDVFHRDLKPQNILLDAQFNVKICDFGWVADQINRKRTTFCGTYEYMAPQMVKQIPYNYKIDIWALGILLYELNHGKAPFPADSSEVIKQKFSKGVYEIKQTLSHEFKMLIVGILQFDPSKRFEIQDIKKSSWIKKFKTLHSQSISKTVTRNSPTSRAELPGSSTIKLVSKDDKYVEDRRYKKHCKKYRTLEEQDLYCITQNMKHSKQGSTKESQRTMQFTKQSLTKDKFPKQNATKSNIKVMEKKDENINIKKKMGSARAHLRTGTQSGQIFHKKLSKIIFQDKYKFFQDDSKKKIATRRN